jgi:PIN domain nuclease of toxin-antitoxin system
MKLLLDTHVLLWWLDDPRQLSSASVAAICDPANEVFVSAASAWEIAIKKSLGKLDAPDNLVDAMNTCRFFPLPIAINHALAIQVLPACHHDPFDRMLLAQAKVEGMTIVTRDAEMLGYDVPRIEA